MEIVFKKIDISVDFDACIDARRDAYFCSFGHYDGLETFLRGYRERMAERLNNPEWFYIHVIVNEKLVGQLEFHTHSSEHNAGYINLIYLKPDFRGCGLAPELHKYIVNKLTKSGCEYVILSVSRTNLRAINFYKKYGWKFVRKNPKHRETDFYGLRLNSINVQI